MKISVSSYSFYQYVNAGKLTLEELPAIAHEIGFDAIEYIDIPGATQEEKIERAKKIRANAEALGMTINAYTIGACLYQPTEEASDAEIKRLCDQLDVAVALGAPVMRHDVVYQESGKGFFTATATVYVSNQFFGWICGFGKQAKIVAPLSVKEEFVKYVSAIYEANK